MIALDVLGYQREYTDYHGGLLNDSTWELGFYEAGPSASDIIHWNDSMRLSFQEIADRIDRYTKDATPQCVPLNPIIEEVIAPMELVCSDA